MDDIVWIWMTIAVFFLLALLGFIHERSQIDYTNKKKILPHLKKRLLKKFLLREKYEVNHATDKEERYRESEVMSWSISTLHKYDDETDLVEYAALLLDRFDKDREYNHGLRKEQSYTTRYIHGAVQSIVENEIKKIESYHSGFMKKVYARKKLLEEDFREQYALDKEKNDV